MNIALLFQHKLVLGLQRLLSGESVRAPQAQYRVHKPVHTAAPVSGLAVARSGAANTVSNRPFAAKVMPLRVLRVVETGQHRSCTGRLVISGRMADVCAELDRLVEREAALH
jgi:hypothetical protein